MRVAFASDHAGLTLKTSLVAAVRELGHEPVDLGPESGASVDYPDFAKKLCAEVVAARVDCGVLVCGTGIGMSMTANKVKGIRAALCHTEFEARMTRAHNDANVLCLGERVVGSGVARGIVEAFLSSKFEGGRHAARVAKIE
ncbi:MAG: ribose 5-phosphate isomerase B [Archangiaceae bacterium]|nr:ribose 5-phosphate isomerase B [Archangiaceae bacterium]